MNMATQYVRHADEFGEKAGYGKRFAMRFLPSLQNKLLDNVLTQEKRLEIFGKKISEDYVKYVQDWWETSARLGEVRLGEIPGVPRSVVERSKHAMYELEGVYGKEAFDPKQPLTNLGFKENIWAVAPLMSYPTIKQLVKEQEE
jgi:hypothetical protein